MKDHSNCRRGFYHYNEAWYSRTIPRDQDVDQIMIGMYPYGGGTTGEFAVRWHNIGGKVTPRLEVYDDAWHALSMFQDLLARMADLDDLDISPAQFVALLKTLNIEDLTPREAPAGAAGSEA